VRLHPTGMFDNSALPMRHIAVLPLAAAMGAEIAGVDLANLTDEQFAEIEAALFRHKMIYFRGQKMDHGHHEAFTLRFGPFAEDAYTSGVDGHRNVHPLIKEADDRSKAVFGGGWHTDSPFLPQPPAITSLRSVEIPPFGGDTIWCNAALAYAALSPAYKRLIDPLRVHFSMRRVLQNAQDSAEARDNPIGRLGATRDLAELPEDIQRKLKGNLHPLVRTHPVTGEKALYVDEAYAVGLEGMGEDESGPILEFLVRHLTQPAFTCRLRWEADMMVLWDNRLVIHQAFNDYFGHRRELYRVTVAGETPN
jgi:alpha-ketoglutarate-dependent taurine dioxygenase